MICISNITPYFAIFSSISVILTGNVTYTDPDTQGTIEELLRRLEDLPYINEHQTKFWMKDLQCITDRFVDSFPKIRNVLYVCLFIIGLLHNLNYALLLFK